MNLHRLLKRQLKKSEFSEEELARLDTFLVQVNDAYISADKDLRHIEGVLEKSSQELYKANLQLKSNVKEITSRLTKVAGNINEIIFEIDLNGCWTYLNPSWVTIMQIPIAECIGRPYNENLTNEEGDSISELFDLKDNTFKYIQKSFQSKTITGDLKWLDITIKSTKNEEDETDGYIGSIRDITNLKLTELALIDAKVKAQKANRAKDDFLSTMSHEIRTPLNAVIGMSYLLLLENPKPDQVENLNALKYSSEHLLGLVNDILDFNKITSESLELEVADFNLEYTLNGLTSIFHNKAKEKDIRFTIKKDSELPEMVVGDSTRFTQILTNLISNAIKFTEEGKVTLDVEVASETEDFYVLDFEIKDTGIGIPEDKIDKIFESFAQADSDTTRKYGGTGLGLAICKKLLQLMGSDLFVESTLGKGSRFYFSIYMKKSDAVAVKTNMAVTKHHSDAIKDLKGIRILVAEDNLINIMVIKKFLTKWNVDYDIAENGLLALDCALNNNYDLILMDLQMPEMNGFDASKAIRETDNPLNKQVPIYALSASTGVDIQDQIADFGMDGLLCKPFNPDELYNTIEEIVNRVPS